MFSELYETLNLLGQGAYGSAYLVRPRKHPRHRYVAKEIRTTHLDQSQRDGALAEAEVLRMMKHSNIIAYIDSFHEGPRLYIIMEYADGGDLAGKIKERKAASGAFDEREVMFVFVQVAAALQHIHFRKVLHRDLKPLNIFLTKDGTVKLGDFGIARVIDSTTVGAQTTIGSPFYLSPEMCNSEAYGVKSDLWSLGVVTYELAMMRVPFHGQNMAAVAMKIISMEPDPLPDTYHPDLVRIVGSFLDKEPSNRPDLEDIFYIPFVQGYVGLHQSHCSERGTGGCEAMVRVPRGPGRVAAAPLAEPEGRAGLDSTAVNAAAVLASAVDHSPASRGSGYGPKPLQDIGNIEHPRGQARSGNRHGGASGTHAGGGHSPKQRHGVVREGQALDVPRSSASGVRSYEANEYLRNMRMAAEAKRRNEAQDREFGAMAWDAAGGDPTGSPATKEEVQRKARLDKEETVVARQRELVLAMQQQQAAKRMARERRQPQLTESGNSDSGTEEDYEITQLPSRGVAPLERQASVSCSSLPPKPPTPKPQPPKPPPPKPVEAIPDDASLSFSDTLSSAGSAFRTERLDVEVTLPAAVGDRTPSEDVGAGASPSCTEGVLVFDMSTKSARKPQLSSASQPLQRRVRPKPAAAAPSPSTGGSSGSSCGSAVATRDSQALQPRTFVKSSAEPSDRGATPTAPQQRRARSLSESAAQPRQQQRQLPLQQRHRQPTNREASSVRGAASRHDGSPSGFAATTTPTPAPRRFRSSGASPATTARANSASSSSLIRAPRLRPLPDRACGPPASWMRGTGNATQGGLSDAPPPAPASEGTFVTQPAHEEADAAASCSSDGDAPKGDAPPPAPASEGTFVTQPAHEEADAAASCRSDGDAPKGDALPAAPASEGTFVTQPAHEEADAAASRGGDGDSPKGASPEGGRGWTIQFVTNQGLDADSDGELSNGDEGLACTPGVDADNTMELDHTSKARPVVMCGTDAATKPDLCMEVAAGGEAGDAADNDGASPEGASVGHVAGDGGWTIQFITNQGLAGDSDGEHSNGAEGLACTPGIDTSNAMKPDHTSKAMPLVMCGDDAAAKPDVRTEVAVSGEAGDAADFDGEATLPTVDVVPEWLHGQPRESPATVP